MRFHTRLVAGIVLATAALGLAPLASRIAVPAAQAQNIGQRVVNGAVVSAESGSVEGATVFLRNRHGHPAGQRSQSESDRS